MRQTLKTSVIPLCFFLMLPLSARAEGLTTGIIDLDIISLDAGSNEEPLIIAAFQPSVVAPTIRNSNLLERVAIRTPNGLPKPSIILGRIAPGDENEFGVEAILPGSIAASVFDYDDLEARERLRKSDPELFKKMVEGGYIDPPRETLIAALQTELKRMNCYRSRIDGDWGPGSQRSVSSYFSTLKTGQSWTTNEPSEELFREILLNGDVRCVTPVASTPREAAPVKRTAPKTQTPKPKKSTAKPKAAPKKKTVAKSTTAPKKATSPSIVGAFR